MRLYVLVVVCFLSACSSKEDQSVVINELKSVGELVIPIDHTMPSRPSSIDYFSEEEILLVSNPYTNSILRYSLASGNWLSEITFEPDGPNGVSRLGAIHQVSTDTLILMDGQALVKVVDAEGKVIFSALPAVNYNILSSTATKAYLHSGFIFLYNRGLFESNWANFKNLENNQIAVSLRLCDTTTHTWLQYPEKFKNDNWDTQFLWYFTTRNDETGELIYANAGSDSIDVISKDFSFKKYFFGSTALGSPKPYPQHLDRGANFQQDRTDWLINTAYVYGHIHYDSFKKRYYRFILLPANNGTSLGDKLLGLLVTDQNFSVVREYIFDEAYQQKLNYGPVFITEEGFHIFSSDESEYHWKWYIFQPSFIRSKNSQ